MGDPNWRGCTRGAACSGDHEIRIFGIQTTGIFVDMSDSQICKPKKNPRNSIGDILRSALHDPMANACLSCVFHDSSEDYLEMHQAQSECIPEAVHKEREHEVVIGVEERTGSGKPAKRTNWREPSNLHGGFSGAFHFKP